MTKYKVKINGEGEFDLKGVYLCKGKNKWKECAWVKVDNKVVYKKEEEKK